MFDSYLEVHAGARGTESHDWAAMLLRMYTSWAESTASRSNDLLYGMVRHWD